MHDWLNDGQVIRILRDRSLINTGALSCRIVILIALQVLRYRFLATSLPTIQRSRLSSPIQSLWTESRQRTTLLRFHHQWILLRTSSSPLRTCPTVNIAYKSLCTIPLAFLVQIPCYCSTARSLQAFLLHQHCKPTLLLFRFCSFFQDPSISRSSSKLESATSVIVSRHRGAFCLTDRRHIHIILSLTLLVSAIHGNSPSNLPSSLISHTFSADVVSLTARLIPP